MQWGSRSGKRFRTAGEMACLGLERRLAGAAGGPHMRPAEEEAIVRIAPEADPAGTAVGCVRSGLDGRREAGRSCRGFPGGIGSWGR